MNLKQTIADLFELEKMPAEKAAETANRLGKLIFQAVLVRVLPLLGEEDLKEYDNVVGKEAGGEAIFKFLGEKVPEFESIIMEEAELLRQELAGEFKAAGV